MDKRQYGLLNCIKQRYLDTNWLAAFQTEETGSNFSPLQSPRQFYLRNLEDNLARPMNEVHINEYSRGSGSELDDKMKALRSSSAMTFNILGNLYCETKSIDDLFASRSYKIAYEHQLPTLKHGMPANLDAMLKGENGDVIACEMKMLEWLTSTPAKLKDKYFDSVNYIFEDSASVFIDVAEILNASPVFVCYDFAQMFKHSLALYNAVRNGKISAQRLTLLNCVWEPPESYNFTTETAEWIAQRTRAEHEGFQEFKRTMAPVESLFAHELGMNFTIRYLPTSKLIDRLLYPEEELARLMRYQ